MTQLKLRLQFLLTVLILSTASILFCQISPNQIVSNGNNTYVFNNEILNYHEMEHLFPNPSYERNLYIKNSKTLKTSKALGILTLSVLGGGSLGFLDMSGTNGFFNTGAGIAVVSIFFLTPLFGTAALITHFAGKSKQKKFLDWYNGKLLQQEKDTGMKLELVPSGDSIGLGVRLTF